MARIPLYNGGEIPANPTGVRVPIVGQGVTAGPAMGQALVKVGQMGAQIVALQARANDTVHIMDADSVMQKHQAEQRLFQEKNKDQETWLPEWQKRVKSAQDYIGKLPVTGSTRQTLDKSLMRWGELQGIEVQGAAFKNSVGRAKQAVYNRATEAAQAGDATGIDRAIDIMPPELLPTEEKEQMRLQLHGTAREVLKTTGLQNAETAQNNNQPEVAISWVEKLRSSKAITDSEANLRISSIESSKLTNDLVTLAYTNPQDAKDLATQHFNSGKGKLQGPQFGRIMEAADGRLNQLDSEGAKDWTRLIQSGVGNKVEAIDSLNADSRLKPQTKQALIDFMDRGPVNDPVGYASLYAEAKNFEGKEGSPEYSRFLSRVDMALKEDQKSSVMAALDSTVKGSKDGASKAKAAIYTRMADDLKAGLFGDLNGRLADPKTMLGAKERAEVDAIKAELSKEKGALWWKDNKTAEDLEMEARKAWWKRSNPNKSDSLFTSEVVEDEAAKRMSSGRMWKAAASYEKWNAENPKATPEEASAYAESLLVRQRATVNDNPLLPPVNGPKIDLNKIIETNAKNLRK